MGFSSKIFQDPLFLASVLTISLISDPPEETDWLLQKLNYDSGETENCS